MTQTIREFRQVVGGTHAVRRALMLLALLGAGTGARAQDSAALATAHPAQWPALPPSLLIQPGTEKIVDGLLARMTLDEKIGQMVQADIASISPEDLRRYKLGSILAGGLSAPSGNLHAGPAAWQEPGRRLQAGRPGGSHRSASGDTDPVRYRRGAWRREGSRRHDISA